MKFDPQQISMDEITAFKAAMENVFAEDYPANIQEAGTPTVRTASGLHLRHRAFAGRIRRPRPVRAAQARKA